MVLAVAVLAMLPGLIALIGWLVFLSSWGWRWLVAALLTAIVAGLAPRRRKWLLDTVEVGRDQAPHLWSLVDRLAQGMEVAAPDRLALTAQLNAGVAHIGCTHCRSPPSRRRTSGAATYLSTRSRIRRASAYGWNARW